MTYSETNFRNYITNILKKIPLCRGLSDYFLIKIPDYKASGSKQLSGVPDYMLIWGGRTIWFEVKDAQSKKSFNLDKISESQYTTIPEMMRAGAEVYCAIYLGTKLVIVPFVRLSEAKFFGHEKSIKLAKLLEWQEGNTW